MAVLAADLDAAGRKFEVAADKELLVLNPQLAKQKLDPLGKLSLEDWTKRQK